jgi:hypothetical protein
MKIFLLLLCAFVSLPAFACGCKKPHRAEDIKSAAQIFKGRVMSVATTHTGTAERQTVQFEVLESLKGHMDRTAIVEFEHGTTSCDLEPLDFQPGQLYLISTSLSRDKQKKKRANTAGKPISSEHFWNNFCSLRELIKEEPAKP